MRTNLQFSVRTYFMEQPSGFSREWICFPSQREPPSSSNFGDAAFSLLSELKAGTEADADLSIDTIALQRRARRFNIR